MKHAIALCLSMLLLATPSLAQEPDQDRASDLEEGMDMMSEGARRLLDGLVGEVEPRMRDLADALREFDFDQLNVDDLSAYHPPERLPNGDIIIRRKRPADDSAPMDNEIEI
ncbi:hypothetical protein [Palleronia sp.]|uniref:hypothetical protein n=1 Tax=Palleronia sp. TaxID=1940284 RepID=UPI0035C7EEA4